MSYRSNENLIIANYIKYFLICYSPIITTDKEDINKLKTQIYLISILQRKFICTYDNCDKRFNSKYERDSHGIMHLDKIIPCPEKGCVKMFRIPSRLQIHMITHLEKKIPCQEKGCGRKFKTMTAAYFHSHVHMEKTIPCEKITCHKKFRSTRDLKYHMITHGDANVVCGKDGCISKFKTKNQLKQHVLRNHSNIKEFVCWCKRDFTTKGELQYHLKTHTPSGQVSKHKQENRARKMIESWGYNIDLETVINAKRGDCVPDVDRHFSRLDFRIVESVNCLLIIEVDEEQHLWYNLSCEMSRMMDIQASLVSAGYILPIHWVRYNPNGKYKIGGNEVNISRSDREIELKKHIDMVCCPTFEPERQVTIHYMYYNLRSEMSGPDIMYDSDFPEVMVDFVTW